LPPAGEAVGSKMARISDNILVLEGRHNRPAVVGAGMGFG
jgi:hypothetical protein